ncbi:MAG: DUF4258 domain-containing protein [Candidatus Rokubacteria bacterium]|nr:DUF4258 domain-containing protein [Candidatus Rokubacteria bacterium]
MRLLVKAGAYAVTIHGLEAMEDDGLTTFDVEACVATGTIVRRQRDRRTGEWKYLVRGHSLDDREIVVVAKIGPRNTAVMLTTYVVDEEA